MDMLDQCVAAWLSWIAPLSLQLVALVALIALAALASRGLSARFRHALWLLVLVKIFVWPGLSAPWSLGNWIRMSPDSTPTDSSIENSHQGDYPPDMMSAGISSGSPPAPSLATTPQPPPTLESSPVAASSNLSASATTHSTFWNSPSMLFAAWLAGVVAFLAFVGVRYTRVLKHLRGAQVVDEGPLRVTLERLAQRLTASDPPDLLLTDRFPSPFLLGIVRPRLVLPAGLPSRLSEAELEDVLLHELIHWRRRDLWVGWVQVIAQALCWFHPLIWWANARLRHERECATDEAVLEHSGRAADAYAETLMRVLLVSRARGSASLGFLGVFEQNAGLQKRLGEIMNDKGQRKPCGARHWVLVALLALFALPMAAQQEPDRKEIPILAFDGVDDYLQVPSHPGLDLHRQSIIEAWVNPNRGEGERAILWRAHVGTLGYAITLMSHAVADDRLDLLFHSGDGERLRTITASDAVPCGEWTHVMARVLPERIELYVNAQQVALQSLRSPTIPVAVPLEIGRAGGNLGMHFSGRIFSLRLWQIAAGVDLPWDKLIIPTDGRENDLVAEWATAGTYLGSDPAEVKNIQHDLFHARLGDRAGTDAADPAVKPMAAAEILEPMAGLYDKRPKPAASSPAVEPALAAVTPQPSALQARIDAANPGDVIQLDAGTVSAPILINKPLTLLGSTSEPSIISVQANQPAIMIRDVAEGSVTLVNLSIRWSPAATDARFDNAAAVAVRDANATLRGCRIEPLERPMQTPYAVLAAGRSSVSFSEGHVTGFAYAIMFTDGANGSVTDSVLLRADHSEVTMHAHSNVTIARNIMGFCNYHAVRNTGGTMTMKDNLVIGCMRAGAYLGNNSAHGLIENNVFLENDGGIWAYAQSDVRVANNVFLENRSLAVSFFASCQLQVADNIFMRSPLGVARQQDGGTGAALTGNVYWSLTSTTQNIPQEANAITADPKLDGMGQANFTPANPAVTGKGLSNPDAFKPVWAKYASRVYPELENRNTETAQSLAALTPTPEPVPPRIINTVPAIGANDVNPALAAITVTFDRDMAPGFSWTGGGENYPPIPEGEKPYWIDRRTCALPVKLEAGHFYRVGINSTSYQNFRSAEGVPARPSVIHFTTTGAPAAAVGQLRAPKIVAMQPPNGALDVDPALTEIRVTFDQPMGPGFSWTGDGDHFPTIPEGKRPRWTDDRLTCILSVQLKPDWPYELGINSPSHKNFQSAAGVPAEPVRYTFATRGAE